jgi:hypothetical protein
MLYLSAGVCAQESLHQWAPCALSCQNLMVLTSWGWQQETGKGWKWGKVFMSWLPRPHVQWIHQPPLEAGASWAAPALELPTLVFAFQIQRQKWVPQILAFRWFTLSLKPAHTIVRLKSPNLKVQLMSSWDRRKEKKESAISKWGKDIHTCWTLHCVGGNSPTQPSSLPPLLSLFWRKKNSIK